MKTAATLWWERYELFEGLFWGCLIVTFLIPNPVTGALVVAALCGAGYSRTRSLKATDTAVHGRRSRTTC